MKRSGQVTVQFLDINGIQITQHAEGLFAVAIQHEVDHLNGLLFIDHLSNLRRRMIEDQFRKGKR